MAEPDTESNELALRAAEVAAEVTEAEKEQDRQRLVAAFMKAATSGARVAALERQAVALERRGAG